ncbi:MAG: Gfo/Idh/MocA family oxidoreductase, partial [Lentisphaeria bacterium]|nr:Gfo/Idh/MocA family oxidoreductase [Lentisphaeria bacterium]
MTVKLGLIGCGGIATHQLNSVWEEGLFELVAGADLRPEQLDSFREKFGMKKGYENYRDLLRDNEVEAVMVCTPTNLHAEMSIAAAETGRPIFCQKPMAMNSHDCYKVKQACEKFGVKLQVGFVRRYDNFWGALKRVVESGELGTPLVWRQFSGGFAPARPFFMEKMEGGGPLIDGMVHNYDFACHCFGTPISVKCNPTKIRHDTTALDTGTVLVEFERGDQIVVSWTWGLPKGVSANAATEVMGGNGMLFFPGSFDAAKTEGKYDKSTEDAFLMVLAGGEEKVVSYKRNSMFHDEMVHFADWVTNGGDPLVSCDEGLVATRIAELA